MDDNGILKQCRIENEALCHTRDALLAMIAWPVEGKMFTRKLSGLRFMARWFQQQVERLFRIEELDGYMAMVIESAPYLSEKIKVLQDEHTTLQNQLSEIATRLERVLPDDFDALNELCNDLKSVLKALGDHMRKENFFIQDSVNQDLGGEGGL